MFFKLHGFPIRNHAELAKQRTSETIYRNIDASDEQHLFLS